MILWTSPNGPGSATWTPKQLHAFDDVIWSVSFSVSGNMLAVSGGDNHCSLWKESMVGGEWKRITEDQREQQQQQLQQQQQQPTPTPVQS